MKYLYVIIVGLGIFILLVILILSFVFPSIFAPSTNPTASPNQTPSATSASPSATPLVFSNTYQEDGFSIKYPGGWGILTCSNSNNFELDPNNPADQKNITCSHSVKPITILVLPENTQCSGNNEMIGNINVSTLTTQIDNYTQYQWCTKTNPVLEITNRVGEGQSTAIGNINYSPVIEEIIKSFQSI